MVGAAIKSASVPAAMTSAVSLPALTVYRLRRNELLRDDRPERRRPGALDGPEPHLAAPSATVGVAGLRRHGELLPVREHDQHLLHLLHRHATDEREGAGPVLKRGEVQAGRPNLLRADARAVLSGLGEEAQALAAVAGIPRQEAEALSLDHDHVLCLHPGERGPDHHERERGGNAEHQGESPRLHGAPAYPVTSSTGTSSSRSVRPARITLACTRAPISSATIMRCRSPTSLTRWPSSCTSRSSGRSPARSAGLPSTTSTTSTQVPPPHSAAAWGGSGRTPPATPR